MGVVASALGLFYMTAAFLALRQAHLEWFAQQATETLAGGAKTKADRRRLFFVAPSAMLYGVAGTALLFKSALAIWLLGGGLLLQALYYVAVWHRLPRGYMEDGQGWRQVWSGAIISAATFAFAAYAIRLGVLS